MQSRKLWLTIAVVILLALGPVAYKALGISDQIVLFCLGSIVTLSASYLGANVLAKKYTGNDV